MLWTIFINDDLNLIIQISNDIQTYLNINRQIAIEKKGQKVVGLEKAWFKTPSLASLKEKFLNIPIKYLKNKTLSALAS